MSGLPWFKCYPRDFNDGMVGLTMEERGAYVTILNLIYAKGAPIDDDPSYFRALLWCSPKAWVKVRAALIVKRKLFAVTVNGAPCLMNKRAAEEIAEAEEKSEKFSEAGRRGAEKSNARHNKSNDLGSARPQPGTSDTDTDSEADTETSEPNGSSVPVVINAQARDLKALQVEAVEAADGAADLTVPAMHHVRDLVSLIEPKTGEPCLWGEVLDAIRMVAARQRKRGKTIRSWSWVAEDALAMRDRRLAGLPDPVVVQFSQATGPPYQSASERASAAAAEGKRLFLEGQNK